MLPPSRDGQLFLPQGIKNRVTKTAREERISQVMDIQSSRCLIAERVFGRLMKVAGSFPFHAMSRRVERDRHLQLLE